MNRKYIFPIFFLLIFCGLHSSYAQSDSALRKQTQEPARKADSEKNTILTQQSEELQVIQVQRMNDSFRLQQLQNEILQTSAADKNKQKALTTERNLLLNKDSVALNRQRAKIDSLRAIVTGFPVVLEEDTLFYMYAKLGSLSPKERAEVDKERIEKIAKDYYFNADSLKITITEYTTDIVYGTEVLVSISEQDAIWMHSTKSQLSENYKNKIAGAIKFYKSEYSWKAIAKESLLALLVLFVLGVLIYLVVRFFRWIKKKIETLKGVRLKGLKFRSYEFLDSNREVGVLFSLLNLVKWIVILILIYLTLPVLFGLFPWTHGFSGQLIGYFLDPIKNILISIWEYLPNFFTIIVLLVFFRYFLRILFYFKSEIEKGSLKIPGFYVDWANPTFQIIRVLVLAFMLIVIFPYLPGSNSQIFKGVSVFLGVLFTFGSAGALGNIVAGLVLTYMRAYRIGDRVKIGEATGDVVEKSLLVTRIRTVKNEIISIPNSTVMSSHTTNFTAEASEHGLILHTTVTIGYDAPWRQIHELLIKAALATELIEKDPAPFVFQNSLDDFFVSYQINAYTKVPNQQQVTYSYLHQNIQDAFNEAGVEIMSAHYSSLRDGNKSTVPEDHLPKDYVKPGFGVHIKKTE